MKHREWITVCDVTRGNNPTIVKAGTIVTVITSRDDEVLIRVGHYGRPFVTKFENLKLK